MGESKTNFIDYVKIYCRSGKGGPGSRHFLRNRRTPKGGPDGGDGGKGGDIILKGHEGLWTLIHLKYQKHIIASDGKPGSGQNKFGADGNNQLIEAPLGTVIKDAETGEQLAEVTENNQEVVLFEGGKGGLGNSHFKHSTNQAPQYAQPGLPGREAWIVMELKLLADVGLVGFPNAGKSTLLASISAARPKIASYAFTTLEPVLGIVAYRDRKSFTMADIPGIIEGAAEGRGLGLRFLRHIERNAALLFMVSADADDPAAKYHTLVQELQRYNPQLLDKKRILAITKSDMLDQELMEATQKELPAEVPAVFISAVQQQGITKLKDLIWKTLND